MFNKTKNLFENGSVKNTTYNRKAIIIDITQKNNLIKSYKLQFKQLGFIAVDGGIKHSKKPIFDIVNSQINKNDPSFINDKEYHNARVLILGYVKRPEKLTIDTHILPKMIDAVKLFKMDNRLRDNCKHITVLLRLFRDNKATNLLKQIEWLID